ncbi:MAG: preprotein translocase subunit YajC [Anaerostipes sp.]|jgi:preprotein translocase subunit YajC|nr:preprotein translocase subunit YajC [Anaerostipes sp.]MDD3745590.1 preprotein translocase subunit YajC [Anaerostipes sp.]
MQSNSLIMTILWFIIIVGGMYILMIRPQQKRDKEQKAMTSAIEAGDSILTSSGFYGVIVDVVDETTVIVEFGNDKHCRIPMEKAAISKVEKANQPKEA